MALAFPDALGEVPAVFRLLGADGRLVRPCPPLPAADIFRMYRTMRLLRRLDERLLNLQRQGRVGFHGACTGQEAGAVGAAAAVSPDDWVFPALREGGVMLYRGYPLDRYVAQVFGRDFGPGRGRNMPAHQADRAVNVVSWSSCIGTQLLHAVGAARAGQKDGRVALAFLGDGATSTGDFRSALQAAESWSAPCVFVCQNNGWSISVGSEAQFRSRSLTDRALALGVAAGRVDGNDALAVRAAVGAASAHARAGHGPVFMELLTYRMGPHSSADDPRRYRSEDEVARWRAKDPVERLRRYLEGSGGWGPGDEARLQAEVERALEDAIARAEAAAPPPSSSATEDVFGPTQEGSLGVRVSSAATRRTP